MHYKSSFTAAAVLCCAGIPAFGQYAPPPPLAPFPGFLNEYLRKDDPSMNKWDIGGTARFRYEIKDQYGIPGIPGSIDFRDHGADVDNSYMMERVRFRTAYTDKWWGAFVEGRSSLVQSDDRWAAAAGTPVPVQKHGPEQDSIDLHQAFVTVGNLKEFPVSLKVGRQEMIYGDERVIGAVGWNNIGRVFDAAKLRWQAEGCALDVFTSRPVIAEDGRFNVENDYEYFTGIYATTTKIPNNSLDAYLLARNVGPKAAAAEPHPQTLQPSARDIYTLGLRLKSAPGKFGPWDYSAELMGQLGNFKAAGPAGARLDHEAYAAVAGGGYTFKDSWATPRLGLEYSFASGDHNATDNKHGTFDNLYPTNHKFYGYMDFFSLQNVHDFRGIFQLKPHSRLSVAVEGHAFWLADKHDSFYNVQGGARAGAAPGSGAGYAINPTYSNFVGTEVDVIAGYALTKYAQLEGGFGHFFTGKYIDQSLSSPAFGSADANFVYLQLGITF